MEDARARMLETNRAQTAYYETPAARPPKKLPMRIWRFARRRMYAIMREGPIWEDVFRFHRAWIGDLRGKSVLDLGCYQGNALSTYLAREADHYLGVDLSASALDRLRVHFAERGIEGARLRAVDVLSDEFDDTGFDLVYAQGVLHHFNPISEVLRILHGKMNPGGRIVSLDPLQTGPFTRTLRFLFHRFRDDKDWEWPFRRETFEQIDRYFRIEHAQGFLGYSKWAVPVAVLHQPTAVRVAGRLHELDLQRANTPSPALWGCLQLALCLEKRTDGD